MKVLVTGGARSGKSAFAEAYAARLSEQEQRHGQERGQEQGQGREREQAVYIATAQAYDEEMRERIALHRRDREAHGYRWTTVEEPYALAETLQAAEAPVVLVDCLTLWLSNWLLRMEHEVEAERKVEAKIEELVSAFVACRSQIVLVTNEVGYGLVPEYKLGRQFRDLSGRMNQRLAKVADQVFLVTSGIPVELKSQAFRLT
ncbi:bifunctional adenosylcobinamide kinase/adenosylcobinamide-phosphate guanylyltransferase [Paenibacillus cremeus]|uniref:Adenosylcobinamide kinase n=1 Tax=Paenibacillus cremeus TaxID=2163881 RepID=A0A559K6C2_9BACL|nr:bifunctional adenosylcobinamide kinase/adenosylcobinamide-phosphate guanylyltransferase [Paenibacillus cremeus]TVY07679.1 bifunctional adenosylcobinamide kinase/adenosylcobinamide-phosphate guanylyltransferase [Paenibacillus cremeus]